ncbi:MAG: phenylphosphate carboxylase subunit delta [Pseudomonadota bacterium]|nr:phenylphosphate carboxylase subunit delta [Pseudomonadota bacterium]
MSFDPAAACPADVLARAAKVRLACFDVDGTLTDGRLLLDGEGRESKAFHVRDGQGLALLKRAGIAVAFVTARPGDAAAHRAADLGVESHALVRDKVAFVRELAQARGLGMDEVAFMGDDLADVVVMREAGFAAAPADAHQWALQHAHWHSLARGGEGAAREFCDLVLAAQGRLAALLP